MVEDGLNKLWHDHIIVYHADVRNCFLKECLNKWGNAHNINHRLKKIKLHVSAQPSRILG